MNLQEVVEQEVEALSQETFQKKPTQAFSPKERLTSEFLYEIKYFKKLAMQRIQLYLFKGEDGKRPTKLSGRKKSLHCCFKPSMFDFVEEIQLVPVTKKTSN